MCSNLSSMYSLGFRVLGLGIVCRVVSHRMCLPAADHILCFTQRTHYKLYIQNSFCSRQTQTPAADHILRFTLHGSKAVVWHVQMLSEHVLSTRNTFYRSLLPTYRSLLTRADAKRTRSIYREHILSRGHCLSIRLQGSGMTRADVLYK
jgi:hypothetical protein